MAHATDESGSLVDAGSTRTLMQGDDASGTTATPQRRVPAHQPPTRTALGAGGWGRSSVHVHVATTPFDARGGHPEQCEDREDGTHHGGANEPGGERVGGATCRDQ
jgi:hypothetical protein